MGALIKWEAGQECLLQLNNQKWCLSAALWSLFIEGVLQWLFDEWALIREALRFEKMFISVELIYVEMMELQSEI